MVLTWVLAESCMSAGPKSVAPVSRPETVMIALCIRCSMKGRARTMRTSLSRPLYTVSVMTVLSLLGPTHARAFVYHCLSEASGVSDIMSVVGFFIKAELST